MAKIQCECGSYLFYIYKENYESRVVCIREENNGIENHNARIREKKVIDV